MYQLEFHKKITPNQNMKIVGNTISFDGKVLAQYNEATKKWTDQKSESFDEVSIENIQPTDTEIKILSVLKTFCHPIFGLIWIVLCALNLSYNRSINDYFVCLMGLMLFLMQMAVYPHIKKVFKDFK